MGSDWVFLLVLGIVMALISFVLDLAIDKCQTGVLRYINFYLLCILCILFFFLFWLYQSLDSRFLKQGLCSVVSLRMRPSWEKIATIA